MIHTATNETMRVCGADMTNMLKSHVWRLSMCGDRQHSCLGCLGATLRYVQHTTVEVGKVKPAVYQHVERESACDHLDVSHPRQNKGLSRCGLPY